MASIRRLADTGLPILLVEQNVKQVLTIIDRAYVLDGPSGEFEGHPMIKKAYLGL